MAQLLCEFLEGVVKAVGLPESLWQVCTVVEPDSSLGKTPVFPRSITLPGPQRGMATLVLPSSAHALSQACPWCHRASLPSLKVPTFLRSSQRLRWVDSVTTSQTAISSVLLAEGVNCLRLDKFLVISVLHSGCQTALRPLQLRCFVILHLQHEPSLPGLLRIGH